jgi:hypothetical protein
MAGRFLEFVWLRTFARAARGVLDDEDLRVIEEALCTNVHSGALMPRTGGFRKLRHPMPGHGKRGGARIIYWPDEACGRVYVTFAYAKARKESLTHAEESVLRMLSAELAAEDCKDVEEEG